jgi:hypothetical protein
LWMAWAVVIRGVWVDGLRSIALEKGFTAFGQSSLMKHPLGVLLVSSRFSRWTYAVCKALCFCFVILANTNPSASVALHDTFGTGIFQALATPLAQPLLGLTLFFCLIRGLPVVLEARRFL